MSDKLPELPHIGPLDRVFARPSWADPTLLVNLTEWTFTDHTIANANPFLIAGNSPIRVAIAFVQAVVNANANFISPTQIPGSFGQRLTNVIGDNMFTLFNYFSMVQGEWYCQGVAPSIIRVYEWTVQV